LTRANDDQASIAPSGWAVEGRESQNGRFGGDSAAGREDHPGDVIYDIATTLKLRQRHFVCELTMMIVVIIMVRHDDDCRVEPSRV